MSWGDLKKKLASPGDTPDYRKASDERSLRWIVVGVVIAGLLLLVATLNLLKS
jgi:hypothetical protein